jgi:hypothetical protein
MTTNKGGRTQMPNRTSEEIQAAEAAQALKQQEKSDKAAAKLAKRCVKVAQKAARNMIKAKEKEASTSRLKWSVEGSLKLLRYVRGLIAARPPKRQKNKACGGCTPFF